MNHLKIMDCKFYNPLQSKIGSVKIDVHLKINDNISRYVTGGLCCLRM